jgi:hypothetical protein
MNTVLDNNWKQLTFESNRFKFDEADFAENFIERIKDEQTVKLGTTSDHLILVFKSSLTIEGEIVFID